MTTNRPFTLIAATLFLLMAAAHAYRLITHFQVIVGTHTIPQEVSWFALAFTLIMAVMLFRESRR